MKDSIKNELNYIRTIISERLRTTIDEYILLFGTTELKATIKNILKNYKQGKIGKLYGKSPFDFKEVGNEKS